VFVIELAESFSLTRLEFDTRVENYQGIAAKDIRVEFSLQGPDKGYEDPQEYSLNPDKVNSFNIEPVQARWVRLTVLSNHGNPEWTELNEFKAFGYPRHESIQQIDIGGVWETNWQMITFSQTKNQFTATYSYDKNNSAVINGKVINGRISRNKLEFQWEEKQLKGTAVLYMNEEGNLLSGKWWNDNRADDFGLWIMHRKEAKPIINVVKEDSIRFGDQKIEIGKKIVLQKLLFVQSKAELVPGAELEMDKLKRLLVSNPNLKVELHGHTDNVGDPGKNQKLSEDRVEMVKNYLISNGIKQRRISGKGYGGSQPVADNSNPESRKLNRRVEFVLY
jgi:outer membrane protein OmpA-like peptidoglycan-associated protein